MPLQELLTEPSARAVREAKDPRPGRVQIVNARLALFKARVLRMRDGVLQETVRVGNNGQSAAASEAAAKALGNVLTLFDEMFLGGKRR